MKSVMTILKHLYQYIIQNLILSNSILNSIQILPFLFIGYKMFYSFVKDCCQLQVF